MIRVSDKTIADVIDGLESHAPVAGETLQRWLDDPSLSLGADQRHLIEQALSAGSPEPFQTFQ